MEQSQINIIIPIATFLLGHIWSWLWFRTRERHNRYLKAIREISRLVNEWYTQIQNLTNLATTSHIRKEHESHSNDIQQQMLAYLNNRLVLPGIMMNLKILRANRRFVSLCQKVEQFLDLLTDECKPQKSAEFKDSSFVKEWEETIAVIYPTAWFLDDTHANPTRTCMWFDQEYLASRKLLKELDQILQEISSEAGRLLR